LSKIIRQVTFFRCGAGGWSHCFIYFSYIRQRHPCRRDGLVNHDICAFHVMLIQVRIKRDLVFIRTLLFRYSRKIKSMFFYNVVNIAFLLLKSIKNGGILKLDGRCYSYLSLKDLSFKIRIIKNTVRYPLTHYFSVAGDYWEGVRKQSSTLWNFTAGKKASF